MVFRKDFDTDDTLVPDMQHELARVKFNIIALEPSCVQIKILSVGASFVQGAKLKFMLDQKREDSKSKFQENLWKILKFHEHFQHIHIVIWLDKW